MTDPSAEEMLALIEEYESVARENIKISEGLRAASHLKFWTARVAMWQAIRSAVLGTREDTQRLDALEKVLGREDLSLLGTAHGGRILSCDTYPSLIGEAPGLRSTLDGLRARLAVSEAGGSLENATAEGKTAKARPAVANQLKNQR